MADSHPTSRAGWLRYLLTGLTRYPLYQLGFLLRRDRTSPFSSSLLIAMAPFFTTVFLALCGERQSRFAWLGLAVGFVGMVIFLIDKLGSVGSAGSLVGEALSLGAALSFAVYGSVNRALVRTYSPKAYTANALLAGTIPLMQISTPAAVFQNWGALSFWSWVAIICMVALPVYVACTLWNWAIAKRSAAAATSFSLLAPILSGILSALFFGEAFGFVQWLGVILVLAGLLLIRYPAELASASEGSGAK